MVRKYIRKTQRQSWSPERMRMAIEAVIKQGCSIRKASIENEVPHATLSRKVQQCRCDPEKQIVLLANPKGYNLQTVFSKKHEDILCDYINTLENQMVGLSQMDVRRLAFQLAEKFNLPHRFNKDVGTAGEDWYRGFCKRNPEALIKRTDSLFEKTKTFTKEKVYKFFDCLENIIEKYQLEASDIYNLDEAIITCSLKSNSKTSSIEKSSNNSTVQNKLVTAQICFSASGVYMPLMLIFPCDKRCKSVLKGAPSGAWAEFDSTGQMQLNIFTKWLKKFIVFSKATKDSPVLLVLDGYKSCLKNLEVLEIIKENGIHIVCLPPNCSGKLQPLQHSFAKTLSTTYTNEVTKWLNSNPGCSVSINEVYHLFGNAFKKVSTVDIPQESFKFTGIWPPERDLFKDEFVPTLDDLSSTRGPLMSSVENVCKGTTNDTSINRTTTIAPGFLKIEPLVIITKGSNRMCVVQSMESLNQENEHFVSFAEQQCTEQQYQIKENPTQPMQLENIAENNEMVDNNCHQDDNMSTVVIPPEAKLSEVQIEDIQSLLQSQKKLYFYVSPYRLKVSS